MPSMTQLLEPVAASLASSIAHSLPRATLNPPGSQWIRSRSRCGAWREPAIRSASQLFPEPEFPMMRVLVRFMSDAGKSWSKGTGCPKGHVIACNLISLTRRSLQVARARHRDRQPMLATNCKWPVAASAPTTAQGHLGQGVCRTACALRSPSAGLQCVERCRCAMPSSQVPRQWRKQAQPPWAAKAELRRCLRQPPVFRHHPNRRVRTTSARFQRSANPSAAGSRDATI